MDRGERPEEREGRLDEVLATFVEALDSGLLPDRREWLVRHPEFYDELTDFFSGHDALERIAAGLRDVAGTADDALALEVLDPPAHPENLGRLADYEVI